jgi:hypothetical protein
MLTHSATNLLMLLPKRKEIIPAPFLPFIEKSHTKAKQPISGT